MGNEISNAGCCTGPPRNGLVRDEERFGRIPEPMPVATIDALKKDRINEWSEPGAMEQAETWWCGEECRHHLAQGSELQGVPLRPVGLKSSAYLVADTPDGAMLMSTERGDGGGSMWLGDVDNDPSKAAVRPIWDPTVRQEFRECDGAGKSGKAKAKQDGQKSS
mmetsp:Transcript_61076/g.122424  ORF Transcript_61076/g.122424 Transcript_61076/m.122424 type:complete len:164 (+) Transcript_61076:86-577(+)